MSSKYEAIHFDMDGVIADTEDYHVAAERITCADYGFAVTEKEWKGFKGRTARSIFTYLIETYGDPQVHHVDALATYKTERFLELVDGKIEPIPGVLPFIEWARTQHRYVTLVTSSVAPVQKKIIDTFGIADVFDAVVTADVIERGKPDPEPYLRALGAVGVTGAQSVVIEDSISGLVSGKAAGCSTLAVTTSHIAAELVVAKPDYIANTYSQAERLLTS